MKNVSKEKPIKLTGPGLLSYMEHIALCQTLSQHCQRINQYLTDSEVEIPENINMLGAELARHVLWAEHNKRAVIAGCATPKAASAT